MKHGEYMIFFYKKRSEDECKLADKLDYLKKLEHDLYWVKFNRKHLKGAVRNSLRDTRKYSGKNLDQAREMLIICLVLTQTGTMMADNCYRGIGNNQLILF